MLGNHNMLHTHEQGDLSLLPSLQELLETRSVTLAAERVGLSQPAMSRILARLRNRLGDALLVRSGSRLVLTPRAETLHAELPAVLSRLNAILTSSAFEPARAERTFVIATSDYGATVVLPNLLARLGREAPGVTVRLVDVPPTPEAELTNGNLDLLFAPQRDLGQAIVWSTLAVERFAFVVRRNHPSLKQPLTLERFCAVPQIALSPGGKPGNPLDERLHRLGALRRVVAHVPTFALVPSLLAASDFGAVLPQRVIAANGAFRLVARPLPFEYPGFTFHQAWHERARHDPGHAWFRRLVLEVAKEQPGRRERRVVIGPSTSDVEGLYERRNRRHRGRRSPSDSSPSRP
jgi:DNA-binding transcriptional LysR family regulator